MKIPEPVTAIAQECAAKHGQDITKAIDCAVRKIQLLPDYGDLVETLIRNCVQELVYDARHANNVATKRQAGYYGGPATVSRGESAGVGEAYKSCLDYFIAGKTLGLVKGSELADIAASEKEKANGHDFNYRLCSHLDQIVPNDKTVSQAVSEKRLRVIFRRYMREVSSTAK